MLYVLKERRESHFDEALQYPDEHDTAVVHTSSRGDEHIERRREQDSSTKHPADQSVQIWFLMVRNHRLGT